MQNRQRSGQISIAITAILVVVVILAASTLYLGFLVTQKPSPNSGTGVGSQNNSQRNLPPSSSGGIASAQTGDSASPANSITVVGTGQASYTPDEALIQISVQTENASATSATSSNALVLTNVIQALESIGISNSSIQTEGYTLSANYASCYSTCVPQITGYSVTNSLQVNITSNDPSSLGLKAGQVIDASVKAGANGINLYFGASSTVLNSATNEALQSAVTSASSQAHAIANSLGVSITGVISSSEGGSYTPPYYYGSYANGLAPAAISTPIMPGTESISATVQVVYSIG